MRIGDFIKSQLANAINGPNHDVYEKRLTAKPPVENFDYVPRCIYFYYVRIDTDGRVRVDHYLDVDGDLRDTSTWKPIPYRKVRTRIRKLVLNARPADARKNPPKLRSCNFEPIPWKRKCYIAIFLDEAHWTFHKVSNGKSSIVFDPVSGTPNHSFFDASDIVLQLPNNGRTDRRSAVVFINHMKGADGNDLGEVEQKFKFDMWLKARYANRSSATMVVNFDPGGTNMGPPERP